MKIKRAETLVCAFNESTPVVQNFLSRKVFSCTGTAIEILARLAEWTDIEVFLEESPFEAKSLAQVLEQLIRNDAVLVEGTKEAERDSTYTQTWRWGAVAGLYQFSLRDQSFLDGKEIAERMRNYAAESPSPPLLSSNEGLRSWDLPSVDKADPLMAEMISRESRRSYSGKSITQSVLATCLYAGNGVKRIENCGDFGLLPKTMSPSGGARNPYELYVYVQNVAGLGAGFYHYSAAEHSLGLVSDQDLPDPASLLGSQSWTNQAAAIIFLVATFERTAWKYRQPLAYRVVLMESGYIAQNILLMANHLGVSASPTGALSESRVEKLLHVREIEQAAIFAVVLGDTAVEEQGRAQSLAEADPDTAEPSRARKRE